MNHKFTTNFFLIAVLVATEHLLGAQSTPIPVPSQCNTRIYVNSGETVPIYQGVSNRLYRLSVIGFTGKPDLPPINGNESKYVGVVATPAGGNPVKIPYVLGAIDVESTTISVTNNSSAATGGPRTYYVCFTYLGP